MTFQAHLKYIKSVAEPGGGKSSTACHRCNQEGHWARSCPLARDRRGGRWSKTEQRFEQHADKPKIQTLSNAKGKVDVYLPVNMFGRKAIVLLDTGCDTSVIGRNLLPTDVEITPTERTLFAANRTEITLLGEALHRVYRRRTGTLCYCRRQAIEELILGID